MDMNKHCLPLANRTSSNKALFITAICRCSSDMDMAAIPAFVQEQETVLKEVQARVCPRLFGTCLVRL